MNEFFNNCDLQKMHEFLIYFGAATTIIMIYFAVLLKVGDRYEGLQKQLVANLFAIIPVGIMFAMLWLVDEKTLLNKACINTRVDTTSMLVWSAAIAIALILNFSLFGRRLRERGFYLR